MESETREFDLLDVDSSFDSDDLYGTDIVAVGEMSQSVSIKLNLRTQYANSVY